MTSGKTANEILQFKLAEDQTNKLITEPCDKYFIYQ